MSFSVIVQSIQDKKYSIEVSPVTTIEQLKQLIQDKSGLAPDTQRLIFAGKEMDDDTRQVVSYDVGPGSPIYLVLRLGGGAAPREKPRKTTNKDDFDPITLEDSEGNPRYFMQCGHAICPDTVKDLAERIFLNPNTNSWDSSLRCPVGGCRREWDLYFWSEVAVLSQDEKNVFADKMTKNYIKTSSTIKQCPSCKTYTEVAQEGGDTVFCACCFVKFCRECSGKWLGKSWCGNTDCRTQPDAKTQINQLLRDAPLKTIDPIKGVPSRRVCPVCVTSRTLIDHVSDCKHMQCPACDGFFCFVCLSIKSATGSWTCGDYNSPCAVAPVQQF